MTKLSKNNFMIKLSSNSISFENKINNGKKLDF